MLTGPLPYAEILLYVAGTFLYGFLVRELVRRPDVLKGVWPLRFLAAALLVWYSGTLLDQWLVFLLGPLPSASFWGSCLDLLRASGWILTPPLLLHTMARLDASARGRLPWASRFAVAVSYASLGLFLVPGFDFLASRSPYLIEATNRVYPLLVVHFAVGLLPAAWLSLSLARRAAGRETQARMRLFLSAFAKLLVALLALLACGLFADPWAARPTLTGGILRTAILGALLLPGVLFAYHVQRYNLLRLSLSNRAVRRLMTVLLIISVAMLAGPALGDSDAAAYPRFVAWGLLVALAWAVLVNAVLEPWLERSPAARAFLGHILTPPELDRLMAGLQTLDGDRETLLDSTGAAVSHWLGCEASFVPRTLATESLWRRVEGGAFHVAHRLERLPSGLARELDRHDLHAVFALRVSDDLVGILGLAASATGGAHADGEIEAVRLVIRQLEASLALRSLSEQRLAAERRASEQERLGMLGLVSASLAHEIKNPLSSMKVLAQALREDLAVKDPSSEGVEDLNVIVDQIDRLDRTAREILGFARSKAGDTTDLVSLIRSAVYVLRAEARKRAVSLALELPDEEVVWVAGSPATWQTVAFNLLRNAVDHAAARQQVVVRIEASVDSVFLEVSNPGCLEAAVRERLFEPFATASGSEGTGLGLALAARRADEVGASITVSEPEGLVVFKVEAQLLEAGAPAHSQQESSRDE